jgi:kinesin family protein 5
MSNDNGIAVCCRIRPTNKVEASENSKHVLNFTSDKTVRIDMGVGTHDFAFDRVFTPDSTQEDVYNETAKPLINEIMNGYNCTVFVCTRFHLFMTVLFWDYYYHYYCNCTCSHKYFCSTL